MAPVEAAANIRKHRITFQEAATVFTDPLAVTYDDPDHAKREIRFLTIGLSTQGRLLIVSHTDLSFVIRIISARRLTRSERTLYEEG